MVENMRSSNAGRKWILNPKKNAVILSSFGLDDKEKFSGKHLLVFEVNSCIIQLFISINRAYAVVTEIAEPYLLGKASASRYHIPDCSFCIGAEQKLRAF